MAKPSIIGIWFAMLKPMVVCFHMLKTVSHVENIEFGIPSWFRHFSAHSLEHWRHLCMDVQSYVLDSYCTVVLFVIPSRALTTDHHPPHERHETIWYLCRLADGVRQNKDGVVFLGRGLSERNHGHDIKLNIQGTSFILEGSTKNNEDPRSSWGIWPLLPMASEVLKWLCKD